VDPGPRYIYGLTAGCLVGPLTVVVTSVLLFRFRESLWEATGDDEDLYGGLMFRLLLGNVVLFIPAFFVGGWVCALVADVRWKILPWNRRRGA